MLENNFILNILLLIKNHILKILGPFGFQESGSLSFDHIVDFHDYITVYLIFIFVLVSWALLYAVNIARIPRFVLLFISCWYGILLFVYATKDVLSFVYSCAVLSNKSLYKTLISSNNVLISFLRNSLEFFEYNVNLPRSQFTKILQIGRILSIGLLISSSIKFLYKSIQVLIYGVVELFLSCYQDELYNLFTHTPLLSTLIQNDMKITLNTEYPWTFLGIHNLGVANPTIDVISLYTVAFRHFAGLRMFKDIFTSLFVISDPDEISAFTRYNLNSILPAITNYNILISLIISFFNNGSKKLSNSENLKNILSNFRSFKSGTILVSRFARRITHASRLEIIWTIFPSIILLLIAIPSLILLYELDAVAPVSLGVKIIGRQWYWSYSIGSSFPIFKDLVTLNLPEFSNWDSYMVADETSHLRLLEVDNPLFLPAGVPITLFITASDVIHSWAVPALGIKVDAIPGRLNQVSFTIYDTGIFYGQCSELCGVNHGFMPIQIISVVDNSHLVH